MSFSEAIKTYQGIFWACGIVFTAGVTYSQMSSDIRAAEKSYRAVEKQLQEYTTESKSKLGRVEERQERFKDDVHQMQRTLDQIRIQLEFQAKQKPPQ